MNKLFTCFVALIVLFIQVSVLFSDVRMPAVIGNDMVLQREIPIQVWGWADPGESVTVQLKNSKATAKANKQGTWRESCFC